MGYLSDAVLVIDKEFVTDFWNGYGSKLVSANLADITQFTVDAQGNLALCFYQQKLYEGEATMNILELAMEEFEDGHQWLRIGEDTGDIERSGDFYEHGFGVFVRQEIDFDDTHPQFKPPTAITEMERSLKDGRRS